MRIPICLYNHLPLVIRDIIDRIFASDIATRITNGAIWSLTGTAMAKFLVLLSGIIIAHILGKIGYGELGMIRSTITMFALSASVGLGQTASKYISEFRESDAKKVQNICSLTFLLALLIGVVIALLVFFMAEEIALYSLDAPYLAIDIRYGALILLFISVVGAQNGILSGFENFKAIALNTLMAGCLEFIFVIAGAYYHGVSGAIVGFGCSYLFLCIINFYSINRNMQKHLIRFRLKKIKREDFAMIWKFTVPAILSTIMMLPVFWYAKTVLVQYAGFGEVAIFDVADQWKILILFIPGALGQIVLPILSNILVKGTEQQYLKVLKINVWINVIVTGGIALVVIIMGKFILRMYGADFVDVYPLIFLVLSAVFTSVCGVVGQAIASQNKMWIGFVFNVLWAGYLLFFAMIFLKNGMGATGLAAAVLLSYVLHTIGQSIYVFRFQKTFQIVKN